MESGLHIFNRNLKIIIYYIPSLYKYPSEYDLFDIYKGIIAANITITPTSLYHRGIYLIHQHNMMNIIQSIQHYYKCQYFVIII